MSGLHDVLERLQELDTRIRNLENLRTDLPRRVALLKSVVDSEVIDLQKSKDQHRVLDDSRRTAERDLEEAKTNLAKAEEKLTNITNNSEYQAAVKENTNLKKRITELEGSLLGLTEKSDAAKKRVDGIDQTYQAHKADYESQKGDVDSRLAEINDQMSKQMSLRGNITSDIPPPVLAKYDRLRKAYQGLAVSPLVGGVCQACHFALTPQKINMIRRGDELFQCDNCQRMLIWKS